MAQDFAKQRTPTGVRRKPVRAATKAVPETSGSHWSWYFSGLLSGVILVVGAYFGMQKLAADAALTAQVEQRSEAAAEPPTFNFGFYDELANAEVAVDISSETRIGVSGAADEAAAQIRQAAPAEAAAVDDENPARYRLQAGSYQNREDAETQRARITLLNMNATVEPGVVSGRTHHRVQVGPFIGRQRAEEAREILAENNIESIPLLMRQPDRPASGSAKSPPPP